MEERELMFFREARLRVLSPCCWLELNGCGYFSQRGRHERMPSVREVVRILLHDIDRGLTSHDQWKVS